MAKLKNPPNQTRLTILRILKKQYPDAVQAVVLEKVAPQGKYSCNPATIRDNLTNMQSTGEVESQIVSSNPFATGFSAYRITEQGLEELEAWLPPVYKLPDNCRVSCAVFDKSAEFVKQKISDLRKPT